MLIISHFCLHSDASYVVHRKQRWVGSVILECSQWKRYWIWWTKFTLLAIYLVVMQHFSILYSKSFTVFSLYIKVFNQFGMDLYIWCEEGSSKQQESFRKTSTSALLTLCQSLWLLITINCGKFWKRWEYQTTWPASWETCRQVRKQQSELDMEQQTSSK